MLKRILVFLVIMIFTFSCQHKEDYVVTADGFVKNYYQYMNQEEAIKFTSMMAKDKLQKELELVKEARIKNPQLESNKSKVSSKLEDTKIEKNTIMLTYKLTIQPQGAPLFDKSALLTLKKESNEWKVIDYQEISM